MRVALLLSLLLPFQAQGQTLRPSERPVDHFHAEGVSRLAALARLGAITGTTMLVQVGAMPFLQAQVNLVLNHTTASSVIDQLLHGPESYTSRDRGNLLIISPVHETNRVLTLHLGHISFRGSSISDLHPYLTYLVRNASGCEPMGYAWAGSPMEAGVPTFDLADPTIEDVLWKVADARKPTMWIFAPEPSQFGCISNPAARWQVLLYGCRFPFQASVGPSFVGWEKMPEGLQDNCSDRDELLPNPIPTLGAQPNPDRSHIPQSSAAPGMPPPPPAP